MEGYSGVSSFLTLFPGKRPRPWRVMRAASADVGTLQVIPPCEKSVTTHHTTLFRDKQTRRPSRGTFKNPVV